jgi:hypothetical protein
MRIAKWLGSLNLQFEIRNPQFRREWLANPGCSSLSNAGSANLALDSSMLQ